MRHPKARKWELRLKGVFDEIDNELERLYGDRFPLHPARVHAGTTSNPEMDGLFNVGASFSAGFGSEYGPGYVVEIRVSTLTDISPEFRAELQDRVQSLLIEKLPAAFPDRQLQVDRTDDHLRIHGDLGLD